MNKKLLFTMAVIVSLFFYVFSPGKPESFQGGEIAPDEYDPEVWGKVYPLQYESWLRTRDPKPAGRSTYKRGWDDDKVVYDKLSEFPFLGLLYHGWGFGIEYNQPRGHYYAVRDQLEIDPSRVSPGGVCLGCKSPFHREMTETHGTGYLKKPFRDAVAMLPEKLRELGPACIDCHHPDPMGLKTKKAHLDEGLRMIDMREPSRRELRTLSLILRAGYATAACAKLFDKLHRARAQGVTVDETIYNHAKDSYMQAFLRLVFINAENSTGFHNPAEAGRVLGDAVAFAGRAEALLRQMLAGAGMDPGLEVHLELGKYLNNRGREGLSFVPDQEFKDPFGVQETLSSEEAKGLP